MKKFTPFIVILMSFIILSLSILPASAKVYDCRDEDTDETDLIENDSLEFILRFYNGAYMYGFGKNESIEEIVEKYSFSPYCVMHPSDEIFDLWCYSLRSEGPSMVNAVNDVAWFFIAETNPVALAGLELKIGAKIEKAICLCGEYCYDGLYIYLKTNGEHEDYVIYKKYLLSDEKYLFPISEFRKYAAEQIEIKEKNSYSEDGSPLYGGGLSVNLNSGWIKGAGKYLVIPIWAKIALIAATAVVINVGYKIKKKIIKKKSVSAVVNTPKITVNQT